MIIQRAKNTAAAFAAAALGLTGGAPAARAQASASYPEIVVVGSAENLSKLPGSGHSLDKKTMENGRPFTVNEILRRIPGVNVRDEEGFGLRPNLGLRGLNPTRSTKVTLLEDGVPAAYAPYGDNASYYHPPIDRFERVEVLKGVGQIRFGPQTIGGVVNYITPQPTEELGGFVSLTGGNRDYFDGKARVTGKRAMFDFTRKQGQGARENTHSYLNDATAKVVLPVSERQTLTLKANAYSEDSTLTYSGLTEAELRNFGFRYNPFRNDKFEGRRYAGSLLHELLAGPAKVVTSLYYSRFSRDWWRQSSATTDGQGGVAAARAAGQRIDPNAINSIQGRLRDYQTYGVESRATVPYDLLGGRSEFEAGLKAQFENQDRRQINGTSPSARTGAVVEDNERNTRAHSAFALNRFGFGPWALTAGLRVEQIDSERINRLTGGRGTDSLARWIPAAGVTWTPADSTTLFAGVHRGFAPPRTEDIIGGAGTATDVGPEDSVNYEAGVRWKPSESVDLDAAYFRNDFRRLIAVGSIAGGSTPLSQGEALFQGVEAAGRYRHGSGLYGRGAYTWLPTARQSTAFTQVVGGAVAAGSLAGNRQPYAPEHLLTAALGGERSGFDASLESVLVGEQFANFSNTRVASADGQSGTLAAYVIWNTAASYEIVSWRTTVFVAVKNLFDRDYIVDRTRGILTGSPRLVQGGVKYSF
ncbi:MAG: TonB-dependent receptor [Elusimicrobiota bacterium]|nr:MAG: TonB-dependent receptor [Elusimicrobiota bacterium]